ncbi:MAG TPA: DUF883 C-terminal domain-containing protein [Dehalococcoidia bacterium]|nr:DUF883 C-terminal domain-containing protein [Dehalococcoidia bacterium]
MSERIPEGMGNEPSPGTSDFETTEPGEVHAHTPSVTAAMAGNRETDDGDAATKAKEKAKEVGRQAQAKADEGINQAAGGLETAADKIREKTPSEGVVGDASEKVASGVESAAGYLRDKDSAQIFEDVEKYAREHPMQALGAALVAGFVIGRILS